MSKKTMCNIRDFGDMGEPMVGINVSSNEETELLAPRGW